MPSSPGEPASVPPSGASVALGSSPSSVGFTLCDSLVFEGASVLCLMALRVRPVLPTALEPPRRGTAF